MPSYHKVTSVDGARNWEGAHGSFTDYTLTVESADGIVRCTQTRKPESPAPTIGEMIFGHLESEEIPKRDGTTFTKTKLKRDQIPDGVPPPTAGPQGTVQQQPVPPPGPTQAVAAPGTLTTEQSIHWAVCLKAAAQVATGNSETTTSGIINFARVLFNAHPVPSTSSETPKAGQGQMQPASPESLDQRIEESGLVEVTDEAGF